MKSWSSALSCTAGKFRVCLARLECALPDWLAAHQGVVVRDRFAEWP